MGGPPIPPLALSLLSLSLFSLSIASFNSQQQLPEKVFVREGADASGGCATLLLDPSSAALYVGCRAFIAKLWAYNINDTAQNVAVTRKLPFSARDEEGCRVEDHPSDCSYNVRQFFLRPSTDSLLVCSSVAKNPELRELDVNKLTDKADKQSMLGVCSTNLRYNSTTVHVEWGNPTDAPTFYSGIRTGLTGENHLIYRPAIKTPHETIPNIRTIYTDNTWLNDPQFVGSFDMGEYVYFFLREVAVEIGYAPPTVYSRVARICKKDVGGRTVLRQVWTSFVKARLNCSISAPFPFYFDHIQWVSRVDVDGEVLFYTSMATSDAAFPTSAICVFPLSTIDQLFDHGLFLEQHSSGVWLPTSADSVPSHRPGSCSSNSSLLSDSDLQFAKTHLLMAEPVGGGGPLIPTRDVFFHSLHVDVFPDHNVIFAVDHHKGQVWKVSHWREGGSHKWTLLHSHPLAVEGRILATTMLSREFLYVSTSSSRVAQFSLSACHLYSSCASCAIDPYCAWSASDAVCARREKAKATGWMTSWAGRGWSECAGAVATHKVAYVGDALHLPFSEGNEESERWKKDGFVLERENVVEDASGGIVLMHVQQRDGGEYSRGHTKYSVLVDTECDHPTTVAGYHAAHREYCKEMKLMKRSVEEFEGACQEGKT